MNKKNLKKTAALMLGLALTVGATGCNFVVTDSARDLEQKVATIDISAALKENDKYGEEIAAAVSEIIGKSEISKRDLVTYFLSVGSSYAESYGYEYTFNMLLDTLINREIIIQYAVAEYLADEESTLTLQGHNDYVKKALENAEKEDAKKAELLKAHPEVLTFEYFLTEGGKEWEDYDRAVYSLKKSLNDSLDSLETQYIKTHEHHHDHASDTRATPMGVGTVKEDYYSTNYGIYTGRNSLAECGDYEKQEGSTTVSRRSAYNNLLSSLHSYGLISTDAGKVENPSDIYHLDYYYVELSSSLTQALINKYYEDLEAEIEGKMDEIYVRGKYDALLAEQTRAYENKPSEFKTAMDSVSDSSFLLYGTENFGFVYSILVPYSTTQGIEFDMYKAQGLKNNDLLLKRADIWADIEAEDLRSTWISDDEHTNYAYEVGDKYYFFEDHFSEEKADQYEAIRHYAGNYPFQGTVVKGDDGEIEKINTKTGKKIDVVLADMLGLIESESGLKSDELTDTNYLGSGMSKYEYYRSTKDYTTDIKKDAEGNKITDENGEYVWVDDDKVEDYSRFIYRQGKLNFNGEEPKANDFFNPESKSYKALSAVNEILFAYSSDPGSLNMGMGYVVSPYGNGYVSEFEEAAQWAVEQGVGAWAIVANDFGWHIVYCSFKYETGAMYTYNHAEAVGDSMVEGSFSNLFYNSLKEKMVSNTTTEIQSMVLNQFNNDKAVQKYQKAYQDLLDM